jgi:hypothetical protein
MSSEKVPVHVSIDRDIWDRFKLHVLNKHGKIHGVLGEEVCNALEMYLMMQSGEEFNDAVRRLLKAVRRFNRSVSSILAELGDAEFKTLNDFGVV